MSTTAKPLAQHLLAALPALGAATIYLYPVLTGRYLPLTDIDSLTFLIQVEWLAMASGMFLIMPLLAVSATQAGRWPRVVGFLLLAAFFSMLAHAEWRWEGVFAYGGLVFLTYGGNALLIRDERIRQFQALFAAGRWVLFMAVFFSGVVYFDLGGGISRWQGEYAALQLGAMFFTLVLVLEVSLLAWIAVRVRPLLMAHRAEH